MSSHSRCFPPTDLLDGAQIDAHAELVASLEAILRFCPPSGSPLAWPSRGFAGLYKGPVSTSYLFYRLSSLYPSLQVRGKSLHEWSLAYLDETETIATQVFSTNDVDVSHCGIGVEPVARKALEAVLHQDPACVNELCQLAISLCDGRKEDEEESNEWLYGRAGLLYLLRVMREGFPSEMESVKHPISHAIACVAKAIIFSERPWRWHGKQYLGAAHGNMGIITQLILSVPTLADEMEPELEELLELQFPSGNFPSSKPVRDDKLVQFCHGAPGFIISLRVIQGYFPRLDTKIAAAIEKARACLEERGLLLKEPCLCHGIAGNVLALENPQKRLDAMQLCTQSELGRIWAVRGRGYDTSRLAALFEGEPGRAWAWAILDQGLEPSCIGYTDV